MAHPDLPDPLDLTLDALETLNQARVPSPGALRQDPGQTQRMQLDAIGRLLAALVISEATPMTVGYADEEGGVRSIGPYLDAGEPDDGPFGDM